MEQNNGCALLRIRDRVRDLVQMKMKKQRKEEGVKRIVSTVEEGRLSELCTFFFFCCALAAENKLVCCCFASAVTAVTHSLKFLGANLVELIDNDKN